MRVEKGAKRELQESLSNKEVEVRNVEKQLEHKTNELKSLSTRFEKQKVAADSFQEKFNKSDIQLKKATTILTGANKAIKHKDLMLVEKQKEINKLESVLRKFTEQKDGKTMSIASITSQVDVLTAVAKTENLPSANSSKTKDS